jgi:peptide-methionine (S)-S-oxide reductase
MHDPTTRNRQGNDVGSQYRSAIFYTTEEQKALAEKGMAEAQTHYKSSTIQTTIEPQGVFHRAEEYHQDYLTKNPHGYECPTHFERYATNFYVYLLWRALKMPFSLTTLLMFLKVLGKD